MDRRSARTNISLIPRHSPEVTPISSCNSVQTPLNELAEILQRVRAQRSAADLLRLRPQLVWHAYREMQALPVLRIHLDDSEQGRRIRTSLGRRIRWAIELPERFDDFVASHERANNMRKSMRRGKREGISCALVEDECDRAAVLSTVLSAWGVLDDPIVDLANSMSLGPAVGTHMVARDSEGLPLGTAIMLTSASTAQLVLLLVDPSHCSPSMIRYALNAFAVEVAIEMGANALLLTSSCFACNPGQRVLATNSGYRIRRILTAGTQAQ